MLLFLSLVAATLAGGITVTLLGADSSMCSMLLKVNWSFGSQPTAGANVSVVLQVNGFFGNKDIKRFEPISAADGKFDLPVPSGLVQKGAQVYVVLIGSGTFGFFATDGFSPKFDITCMGSTAAATAPMMTLAPATLAPAQMVALNIKFSGQKSFLCDNEFELPFTWRVTDSSLLATGDKITIQFIGERSGKVHFETAPIDAMLGSYRVISKAFPRAALTERVFVRGVKSGSPNVVSSAPLMDEFFHIICGDPLITVDKPEGLFTFLNCGDEFGVTLFYNFEMSDVVQPIKPINVVVWVDSPKLFGSDFVYQMQTLTYPANFVKFKLPDPLPSEWTTSKYGEFYVVVESGDDEFDNLFFDSPLFSSNPSVSCDRAKTPMTVNGPATRATTVTKTTTMAMTTTTTSMMGQQQTMSSFAIDRCIISQFVVTVLAMLYIFG